MSGACCHPSSLSMPELQAQLAFSPVLLVVCLAAELLHACSWSHRQPSGTARGQASDIQNEARELMRIRGYINKVLSEATGKPIEKVSCAFDWMLQVPSGALAIWLALEGRLRNVCIWLPSQHCVLLSQWSLANAPGFGGSG